MRAMWDIVAQMPTMRGTMSDDDDDDHKKLLALKRERWHRQCRGLLTSFAVEALSAQGLSPAAHHRLIMNELSMVADGTTPRLILIAPRGAAKTTYVSHMLPAWYFATRPRTSIIAVSHTEQPAEVNSRTVQRLVKEHTAVLGYDLLSDAAGRWETSNGCSYTAAGVGQAVRGRRADLILVDDPLRSRAEAESETSRNSLWEFFHADLLPCLKPRGSVVLIATAYHELDLMCRLEREQPEIWKVVRLPAISEGDGDPLGRPEGVPLWLDDNGFGYGEGLLRQQDEYLRHGRVRDWFAQFQGRPQPPDGNLFKPGQMPVIDRLPGAPYETIRAWDLAASRFGDYTVGLKLCRCIAGDYSDGYFITDVQRLRGPPEAVQRLVTGVAASDDPMTKIVLPQDPGQAGLDQVMHYTKLLTGRALITQRMSGSKETRAYAAAAQANIGRISMLRAPWNAALQDELASFPSGVHDDQVDALSSAFNAMTPSTLDTWLRL
jgi:predicted phage terminase large subunit-like protein